MYSNHDKIKSRGEAIDLDEILGDGPNGSAGPAIIIKESTGHAGAAGTASAKPNAANTITTANNHLLRARQMRAACYPQLKFWRGDFLQYAGGAYRVVAESTIESGAWNWLDRAHVKKSDGGIMPFCPARKSVAETLAALRADVHVEPDRAMPCWLDGRADPPPADIIAFPNGLLDVRTNQLLPSTPLFFSMAALGFPWQSEAQTPHRWLAFLDAIFSGEREQIDLLQEIIGYLIANDVSQEKATIFLGSPRSGKGTIIRMIREMLGADAIIGPSLKSLGTNFGLAPLIGKQLAVIDDLRLDRWGARALVENLLKITGRGFFTIDRKYKDAWSGTLPINLLITSNELPELGDSSGAIAVRMITLMTRRSFQDREDVHLFSEKLRPERLGVLHWALAGLRRLRERGHFPGTEASREGRERQALLGSPVRAFVSECCVLDPAAITPKDTIYTLWCGWAEANNLKPGTKDRFCEAIYAAFPTAVRPSRPRDGSERVWSFSGIKPDVFFTSSPRRAK